MAGKLAGDAPGPDPGYRLVVFTALADFKASPWWSIVSASPHVTRVLVCQQTRPGGWRAAMHSLRANLRKHGVLFIPYRLWATVGKRRADVPHSVRLGSRSLDVERISATSIHAEDVIAAVKAWAPDIGLSIGAPILRERLFTVPRFGTINVHCGEVPFFRGAPPGFWEIATGADHIGATVHRVEAGLDTGRILAQASAPLYDSDTVGSAAARAFELGEQLFERAFARICSAPTLPGVPQPPGGKTYRSPLVAQRMRVGARIISRRIRRGLSPRVLGKRLAAMALLGFARPVRDLFRTVAGRHPVRVFNFHRVTNLCRDGMTVSPATFAEQVRYICRRNDVVSLARALHAMRTGERLRRPMAVIGFDDAYRSVFTHAAPILRAQGVTGTCFVSTGLAGTDRRFDHDADSPIRNLLDVMSWEELDALHEEGWCIGGHTVNHARLSACTPAELHHELAESRAAIEKRYGSGDVALAYPFGSTTDITDEGRNLARELGYVACFGNFGGENTPTSDFFRLRRADMGANHDRLMWKLYANGYDLANVRRRFFSSRAPERGG